LMSGRAVGVFQRKPFNRRCMILGVGGVSAPLPVSPTPDWRFPLVTVPEEQAYLQVLVKLIERCFITLSWHGHRDRLPPHLPAPGRRRGWSSRKRRLSALVVF